MTEPAPQPTQDDRISKLESMMQTIIDKLPLTHDQAQEHVEHKLDRPSSVEEQMAAAKRQAKAEAKAELAAENDRAATKARVDDHEKQLAAMRERPPAEAKSWKERMWA